MAVIDKIRRFDAFLNPKVTSQRASWDTVLLQSEQFVAVPSKGSLVPGWVLVVPRRSVSSLAQLEKAERESLYLFVEQVSRHLQQSFGPLTAFEHGASGYGSAYGCGVDHAHLHLAPLPFDLASAVIANSKSFFSWRPVSGAFWNAVDRERDYLALQSNNGNALVADQAPPVSQYFRRVIAHELGIGDRWDYRTHSFENNVFETINKFSAGLPK